MHEWYYYSILIHEGQCELKLCGTSHDDDNCPQFHVTFSISFFLMISGGLSELIFRTEAQIELKSDSHAWHQYTWKVYRLHQNIIRYSVLHNRQYFTVVCLPPCYCFHQLTLCRSKMQAKKKQYESADFASRVHKHHIVWRWFFPTKYESSSRSTWRKINSKACHANPLKWRFEEKFLCFCVSTERVFWQTSQFPANTKNFHRICSFIFLLIISSDSCMV